MIITQEVIYQWDGVTFRAFCAFPEKKTHAPAVLVAPTWAGRDKFICSVAENMAKKGYVGFAIDLYGDAKVGTSNQENSGLMEPLIENNDLLLSRLEEALKALAALVRVDGNNIAAMGFCFGGKCVLDMARANLPITCAIIFHGNLKSQIISQDNISSKILVLHGYNDPMVPPDHVNEFQKEMDSRNADWQVHTFGNTMHAFTNPHANDPGFGTVYNQLSNNRAWKIAYNFLVENVV